MNTFRYLDGPCLVCRRQPLGTAHGITPGQAVCDVCWIDKHDAAMTALNEVQGIEPDPEKQAFIDKIWETPAREVVKLVKEGELNRDLVIEAEQAGKKRKTVLDLVNLDLAKLELAE